MTTIETISVFKVITSYCENNKLIDDFVKNYICKHVNITDAFQEFAKANKLSLKPHNIL